jgi:hypothetical protein
MLGNSPTEVRARIELPVAPAVLLLVIACAFQNPVEQRPAVPPGPHNVLFVGNSLTYTNDLPATLVALAALSGDTVYAASATAANVALIDHLKGATNAVQQIQLGGWQYVILQQGPTPAGICRDSLVLWTQMFDTLIRRAGARTAVLMVWPYQGPLSWFDEILASFATAASVSHGYLFPAGEAWYLALSADPSLPLYSADGFHPSPMGTYLAALEIYERVTGRDPRLLPPKAVVSGTDLRLSDATIRALQSAAHQANVVYPPPDLSGVSAMRSAPAAPKPALQVGHC